MGLWPAKLRSLLKNRFALCGRQISRQGQGVQLAARAERHVLPLHPEQVRRRDEQLPHPAAPGFTAQRLPLGGRLGKNRWHGHGPPSPHIPRLSAPSTTGGSGAPSGEAKRPDLRRLALRSRRSRRVRYRRRCPGARRWCSDRPIHATSTGSGKSRNASTKSRWSSVTGHPSDSRALRANSSAAEERAIP